ncbi:MAG: hypothetical protein RL220_1686 [Bacteroidota bacterium]
MLIALGSCKKEEAPVIDLGYDYFPNTAGTFIIYEVDSTGFDINGETNLVYEVMEVLAEEFVDGENQLAMKVERYYRMNEDDPWVMGNVWVQKRNNSSAQRVEDNTRYIRMSFPVEVGKTWNGNAYNTMPEWSYKYVSKDTPRVFNGMTFEKTAEIQQRNNINLIDQEIASEIYARGVGLIYKHLMDLQVQQGDITGVDMTLTIKEFGVLEE